MEIGKNFYQYQIQSLIAESPIARNWAGRHHSLNRNVRIKQMKTHLLQTEAQKIQLRTLATQGATLQHSHIQLLYDYLENSQGIFFVYEHIEGVTLDKFIQKNPTEQVRKDIFIQILDALAYSHRKGIYHLNLDPQNIIINSKNQVFITDFGFSIFSEPNANAFASPEFLQQSYTDARSDIYSLGKTLNYLFPNPPQNLQKIITKACDADAYKRYQTCESMKADLLSEFFVISHQEKPVQKNKYMPFVWGGAGLVATIAFILLIKGLLASNDKKPKEVSFKGNSPVVIKDTTDYTKQAEQKEKEQEENKEDEKKTPEEKKKDSLDKIKKDKKEAREKREKERKEQALKKVVVDGQFVSNQLGDYKINVEIFNSNKDLELQNVVLVVSYYNGAGDVIEKEEKTLAKLKANEATAVEIVKKVNAARFTCKLKDAILPPDPNAPKEDEEEDDK